MISPLGEIPPTRTKPPFVRSRTFLSSLDIFLPRYQGVAGTHELRNQLYTSERLHATDQLTFFPHDISVRSVSRTTLNNPRNLFGFPLSALVSLCFPWEPSYKKPPAYPLTLFPLPVVCLSHITDPVSFSHSLLCTTTCPFFSSCCSVPFDPFLSALAIQSHLALTAQPVAKSSGFSFLLFPVGCLQARIERPKNGAARVHTLSLSLSLMIVDSDNDSCSRPSPILYY